MNLQCNFDFEYFDFGFLLLLRRFHFPLTHFVPSVARWQLNQRAAPKKCRTRRRDIQIQVKCRDARERNYLYDEIVVTIVREFQKYFSVEGKNTFLTPKHSTLSVHITYLICVKEISLYSGRFIYVLNLRIKYLGLSLSLSLSFYLPIQPFN